MLGYGFAVQPMPSSAASTLSDRIERVVHVDLSLASWRVVLLEAPAAAGKLIVPKTATVAAVARSFNRFCVLFIANSFCKFGRYGPACLYAR